MRKILMVFLSLLIILFQSSSLLHAEGTSNSINVIIDGVVQKYDTSPVIQNSSVMVPMRSIFETLGAEVVWDESTKTVMAARDDRNIQITIGSLYAVKNGVNIKLPVEPTIIKDVTMVPLRFVSEALGSSVSWDNNLKTVTITNNEDEQKDINISSPTDILTYEQAVELALKNSYNLKSAIESVKRAEEMRNQASDNLRFTPIGYGTTEEDAANRAALLALTQSDTSWQMARKQISILEETIAFQVRGAYDDILKKINEIKIADIAVENAQVQLDITAAKVRSGMESQFNLTRARNTYNEEKQKRELLNKQLDEAYLAFNQLLGIDDGSQYQLLEGSTLVTQDDVSLDSHVHRVLNNDPYIWLQEQRVKMAEMALTLYTFNVGMEAYSVKEIDVTTEKYSLANLKQRVEETTRSRYYQMKQLEDQYAILKVNLDKAEDYLKLVTAQYNLGMAIKADVMQAEMGVAQLKNELQNIVTAHENLTLLFNTPWIVPYQ